MMNAKYRRKDLVNIAVEPQDYEVLGRCGSGIPHSCLTMLFKFVGGNRELRIIIEVETLNSILPLVSSTYLSQELHVRLDFASRV